MLFRKLKLVLFFFNLFLLVNCKSKEEKFILKIEHFANNMQIDSLKKNCTKDTNFFLKIAVDPILNMGNNDSKETMIKIFKSVDFEKENNLWKCKYLDNDGKLKYMKASIIEKFDYDIRNKRMFLDLKWRSALKD